MGQISALLSRAEAAHSKYEQQELGGKRDEKWPQWYATYLVRNGLPSLLSLNADTDKARQELGARLGQQLAQADQLYRAEAPTEIWQDYYAKYLLTATMKGNS